MLQEDSLNSEQLEAVQQWMPLIQTIVQVAQAPDKADAFEPILQQMEDNGLTKLTHIIRQVIAGERSETRLCQDLNKNEAVFTQVLLRAVNNPDKLNM